MMKNKCMHVCYKVHDPWKEEARTGKHDFNKKIKLKSEHAGKVCSWQYKWSNIVNIVMILVHCIAGH